MQLPLQDNGNYTLEQAFWSFKEATPGMPQWVRKEGWMVKSTCFRVGSSPSRPSLVSMCWYQVVWNQVIYLHVSLQLFCILLLCITGNRCLNHALLGSIRNYRNLEVGCRPLGQREPRKKLCKPCRPSWRFTTSAEGRVSVYMWSPLLSLLF